jgi:phosphoribosylcarboxyaminoimidazole (NCAIR) mutase
MLASSNPADYKTVLALAAKSKRWADVIHALTPRGVAAVPPAALDELRQKRSAQAGRQTPSGVMPDEVARASLGLR